MVSEFLTLIRKLSVPDSIPNHQLLEDKDWLLDKNQNLYYSYTELLEYGKYNYWDRNKITNQMVHFATQIFPYVFSNC